MTLVWRWARKGANLQEFLVLVWRATGTVLEQWGAPSSRRMERQVEGETVLLMGSGAKAGKKRFVVLWPRSDGIVLETEMGAQASHDDAACHVRLPAAV
ncbi:hypothetical protein V8C34DRAFT_285642 [Trichoderma compactum]